LLAFQENCKKLPRSVVFSSHYAHKRSAHAGEDHVSREGTEDSGDSEWDRARSEALSDGSRLPGGSSEGGWRFSGSTKLTHAESVTPCRRGRADGEHVLHSCPSLCSEATLGLPIRRSSGEFRGEAAAVARGRGPQASNAPLDGAHVGSLKSRTPEVLRRRRPRRRVGDLDPGDGVPKEGGSVNRCDASAVA
jgi:hypothetical protein